MDIFFLQDNYMEMAHMYFVGWSMEAMELRTEFAALTFLAAVVSAGGVGGEGGGRGDLACTQCGCWCKCSPMFAHLPRSCALLPWFKCYA